MAGMMVGTNGAPELAAKVWRDGGGGVVRYRWHEPPRRDEGARFPLVVFLHGAGERGDDNRAQLKHGVADIVKWSKENKQPCFLMAPQCPAKEGWAAVDRKTMDLAAGAKPGATLARVWRLVGELTREHPVDQALVYLTGLSMGGYGTWSLLAAAPEGIAAAAPICGGGDPATAGRFARVPVWAFHGAQDKVVPVAASRRMIEALKKAGGSPRFTEYPGIAHNSWTRTYRDGELLGWMFGQRRAPSP